MPSETAYAAWQPSQWSRPVITWGSAPPPRSISRASRRKVPRQAGQRRRRTRRDFIGSDRVRRSYSLNDVVRPEEQRARYRDTESLRGLLTEDQLESGGLF